MLHFLRPIMLLALVVSLFSCEILSWDEMLSAIRAGKKGPYAVYLGSPDNHLPRLLRAGKIDTSEVTIVIVPATVAVTNPMTNQVISGAKLHAFFTASAGTVLFLDEDALPLAQLSIPQAMHGDDPELFALYFAYVAGGHYKTMAIADYCRALGKDHVVARAIQRIKSGFSGRELKPEEKILTARNHVTGEAVDPWLENGVFHIYSSSADGRVFMAQIVEILAAFGSLNPRVTLIVPDGMEPNMSQIRSGAGLVLAHASKGAIQEMGASPIVVFTASVNGVNRGMRLEGFQPSDVLAKLIGLPMTDLSTVNRDIPYAEVDETGREMIISPNAAPDHELRKSLPEVHALTQSDLRSEPGIMGTGP
jgi:hypothetical protein